MRVLVTGANGHIGANLARELLRRGHAVTAMVREGADLRGLEGLTVDLARGDVRDRASVDAAAEGCDAIENLAAVYQTGSADPEAILRPAVEGIRNVLEVAAARGIARVVHTSSVVAVGTSDQPDRALDETAWNDRAEDAYWRAKTESEREAWRLASELGVSLVCINPAGILGPWDYRATPSSAWIEALARGGSLTVPGGFSYVDVRDVAWMHAEALTAGRPGERYLCVGHYAEIHDMGRIIDGMTGRRTARVAFFPRPVVLGYAAVIERFDRWRGVEPRLSYTATAEVTHRWARFDGAKAARELGFVPRPADEMYRDALRWAAFVGRLDPTGWRFDASPVPEWGGPAAG